MATIEAFEAALKDVVKAKRISLSKMNTLTEAALKCMDNDVQMVSTLYRTHRGLTASGKIASLYAFDALARAARNRVVKNNITGDLSSDKGNCATFLLRIEGILEGLYRDLASSNSDELKEKAKKILDIWTKQNTFSSSVLSPLYSVLEQEGKDKEPDHAGTTNVASTEPSAPALPPANPVPQPPAVPPVDVNALYALLKTVGVATTAAPAVAATQIPPNTYLAPPPPVPPVPVLDASQLAFLQQLTQTAHGNAVPSQPVPVPASVVPPLTTPNAEPVVPPVPGPPQPQPFPYRDEHYGAPASAPHRESEHDRFDGADRGYPRADYDGPRRGSRGAPRERGRGGRGRGRWDDRDHRRERSREFSRDPRPRRSRSRSPPGRYGGPGPGSAPRDAQPYSPPPPPGRRGGYGQRAPQGYGPRAAGTAGREPEAGKDEFGRDIRPASPRDSDSASVRAYQRRSASPLPPRTGSVTTSDRGSVASEHAHAPPAAGGPSYAQAYPDALPHSQSYHPGPAPSPSVSPSTSTAPLSPTQQRPGGGALLEGFDRTNFDFADPASWEALAKAWIATHGTMPTQEQLMQFIMGGTTLAPQQPAASYGASLPLQDQTQPQHQYQQQPQHQPQHRQESPPPSQPPPGPQYSQSYGDGGPRQQQWQGQESGRPQWNNRGPQESRGDWRGGARGGRGDFGGGPNPGRARSRGRGDFDRGGYGGRGDPGQRGGFGREDRGRGQYGNSNVRGAYGRGPGFREQEQDTDAVVLGGGSGDEQAWQEQQGRHGPSYGQEHRGPPYGQEQQGYQAPAPASSGPYGQPQPPSFQSQPPPFQAQPPPFQGQPPPFQPPQAYAAALQSSQEAGGVGAGGGGSGGGGTGGRMQKVGDKWVFVRGTA